MLLTPTLYNIKNPKNGAMLCLVAQLYPTLCQPMDCSPPGSSVHGDSPGHNTGLGCHALLQGIFPKQGSNQYLCPALAGGFFTTRTTWEAHCVYREVVIVEISTWNRGVLNCFNEKILFHLNGVPIIISHEIPAIHDLVLSVNCC